MANENLTNRDYTGIFVTINNTIYVVDQKSGQVLVWHNGSSIPTRSIARDLINPASIFVDVYDNIYIDNGDQNKRVDKWINNSTVAEHLVDVNGSCAGLFVDNNQRLYCSIAEYHVVVKVDLTNHSRIWTRIAGTGCPGPVPNTLDQPSGIFVDGSFNVYVADTYNDRIQRFSLDEANGYTVAGFDSSTHFRLNRPTGIILDGYSRFFIVDSHNHRIIRSVQEGFKCIVGCTEIPGDTPYELYCPHSMAFDNTGNIFVTDWKNHRVQIFYLSTNPSSGGEFIYQNPLHAYLSIAVFRMTLTRQI